VPSTFLSYMACQASIFASATGSAPMAPPATLTKAVSGSCRARNFMRLATESSSVRSAGQNLHPICLPSSLIRPSLRAVAITSNPSATSRRAVASPIPVDAPVTSTRPRAISTLFPAASFSCTRQCCRPVLPRNSVRCPATSTIPQPPGGAWHRPRAAAFCLRARIYSRASRRPAIRCFGGALLS